MKLIIRKGLMDSERYSPEETIGVHMASMTAETQQGWVMLYVNEDGAVLVQRLKANGILDDSDEGILYHREGP